MLEISEEIKDLYRNGTESKSLVLSFPALGLKIENENIYYETMNVTESISEGDELTFGDCNAAEFKITVADITADLNGQQFTVTQVLNGDSNYSMPLGTYTVKSCKRQSDRRFKDIVAYDDMIKLDKDVVAWYNSRTFPVTLKTLRESLLVYCGIAYETQDLPNDGVLINKTVRPSAMNGRDVMKRICELNGGFGHITRQNKFKVITLAGLGLYPSETLYPSEDLFPAESGEIIDGSSSGASYYPESTYEDYICRAIDQLKIRTNEEDGGVTVNNGTAGTNEYIIQGNFLISDKSKAELTDIAEALFLVIKNKYYRPHNMIVTGLPYLEVGDSILINTKDDVIESFIFTRTLSGIQALKDSLGATGYEYRQNKIGLDTQISQLEQTTATIQEDIEDIEEFNGETSVSLKKLEDGIAAEVSRATEAEGKLSAQISITASEVSSKVSKGDVVSEINQSAEAIVLKANRLIVESDNFSLDENGKAEYSGDLIVSGSDSNGTIYKVVISPDVSDITCAITETDGTTYSAFLNGAHLNLSLNGTKNIQINAAGSITCKKINGYTPIHAGNISSQHVYSAEYAEKAWNESSNEHTANCFITEAMTIYKVPSGSSIRFKNDISEELNEFLNPQKLYELPVVQFKYKPDFFGLPEDTEMPTVIGIIAEDVEEIYPCAAEKDEDSGKVNNWNVRYIVPPMLKLIQEHKKEINSLKQELSDLKTLLTEKGVI